MKKGLVALLVMVALVLPSFALADDGRPTTQKYAGVVETDKGAGVYTLHKQPNSSFSVDVDAWGGAMAEFIRRHQDRQISTVLEVERYAQGNILISVVIITVPNRGER